MHGVCYHMIIFMSLTSIFFLKMNLKMTLKMLPHYWSMERSVSANHRERRAPHHSIR